MENTNERAYVEVLEVINNLDEEERSKIPQEKIEFFEKHKDKNYEFKIDKSIDLEKQPLSRKAYAIIIALYLDYYADDEEKKEIQKALEENEKKAEILKREKYNPNDIFKKEKIEEDSNIEEKNLDEILPTVNKEHWYTKILNFFKSHFRKN